MSQVYPTPQEIFATLPSGLRDKILPPKKLSKSERNLAAKRNASIVPAKFRSAVSAQRARSGETAPATNRGVTSSLDFTYQSIPSIEAKEILKIVPLGKQGRYESIRIPLKNKSFSASHSFVDYISFTFKSLDLPLQCLDGYQAIDDSEYVTCLSIKLQEIFGYGITSKRQTGINFYKTSYDIGVNGFGIVGIGGQYDSVQVTIKGQGLMGAKPAWELRLLHFLKSIRSAKITRVDLASDNFNSKTSLNDYLVMYRSGLFSCRGKLPNVECVGNWENPTGKGRTLYIGSRNSGKLLRIYEKGLQIAQGYHEMYPNWVRVELELKNQERIIPFDVLVNPGQYLAGAYPALAKMHKKQEVIKTFKKTVKSSFERSIENTRNQYGKYIYTIIGILGVEEGLERLTRGKEEVPKKIDFKNYLGIDNDFYIHNVKPTIRTLEEMPI